MRTPAQKFLAVALLSTPLFGLACVPGEEDAGIHESEAAGFGSLNGLGSINGLSSLNGLGSANGLHSANGLSSANGLGSVNGLSSANGLMTTDGGRSTVAYIVKCALPAGRSLRKSYNGVNYTYPGLLGIAPEWETGACGKDCQENVSACVLAHVNTTGKNISIMLNSDKLGFGQNSSTPYMEGSFFGNIFTSPPKAYFCNGNDFDLGVVPGRLGSTQSGSPYVNPFYSGATCKNSCTAAPGSYSKDGFTKCADYNHVVTVFRNFDAATKYKICNHNGGKCLDTAGSTANLAPIVLKTFTGAASQKWTITQVCPLKYKVINSGSGKALDITGGSTADGTAVIQYTYNGGTNQLWSYTALPDQPGFYKISPTSNPNASLDPHISPPPEGTPVKEWTYNTADMQKWTITVAN